MLHCKGFVPGFYLVLYVFPVCFVPICLWPAFILEHNTYITQPGRSQQIEFSTEKKDVSNGIGTEIEKLKRIFWTNVPCTRLKARLRLRFESFPGGRGDWCLE